jgi:acetyltransferase-like isoleucine patch superfamily enzyme
MPKDVSGQPPIAGPRDPSAGLQGLLILDVWLRTLIWSAALAVTMLVLGRIQFVRSISWDTVRTWSGAWLFSVTIMGFFILFNVAYILTLVIIRLPFPSPERGVIRIEGAPPGRIILAAFLAVLTKARYHPPFPAVFVPQFASIQPFRWLLSRTIGPRTESSFFLDPNILDPWGIKIGKNVTIGFGAMITCHLQERDYIIIDNVVIEDDVSIGALAGIGCGVHIKRGAVIDPYSAVKPNTIIGEYEQWGGRPAHLKGTLKPPRSLDRQADSVPASR